MAKAKKILVLHGPNLNLLGSRETDVYGSLSLTDINKQMKALAKDLGVSVSCAQHNAEGDMVNAIQKAQSSFDGLVINPAAYTHTSVAIRDALLAVEIPTAEVHLSNIYKREEFRQHSFVAPVVIGQISGFGIDSYLMGLRAMANHLANQD